MSRLNMAFGAIVMVTHAVTIAAQASGGGQSLRLRSGTISLAGTSNLRSFSCVSSAIDARILLGGDTALGAAPGSLPRIRVEVTVPLRSLDCGVAGITRDMYRTLEGNDFPTIAYRLVSYEAVATSTVGDSVVVTTHGVLTVAGKDKAVEMTVTGRRMPDGCLSATGSLGINMSDFGIAPPKLFFGALRVHDAITVRFDLLADPAAPDRR